MSDQSFTTTEDLLRQVVYLTDLGRLPQALLLAKRAVALDPKNLPAVLELMNLHAQMNRPDLALLVAEEARRAGMSGSLLYFSISGYRRQLGDLEGAEAAAIEAVALAPDQSRPLVALALVRHDQKRHEEALAILGRAVELPDSGLALEQTIRIGTELERHAEVVAACKSYLRRYGRSADVLQLLGEAYFGLDDLKRAERAYRDAIEEAPHSVASHCSLVLFLLASKNEEAAKRHLAALSVSSPELVDAVVEQIDKAIAVTKTEGQQEPL